MTKFLTLLGVELQVLKWFRHLPDWEAIPFVILIAVPPCSLLLYAVWYWRIRPFVEIKGYDTSLDEVHNIQSVETGGIWPPPPSGNH